MAYFKGEVGDNNYVVNQLKLQDDIADNQLRIGRAGYVPTIALMGKQTLYSNGIQKNLIPRTFVGVGFTWNLFDGLDREQKIRQAKITKQTVGITRDKAIDDISVGIDKFYSQMQNALSSVNALNTTIELSRELVRMRKKAFTEGMGHVDRSCRCRSNALQSGNRLAAGFLPIRRSVDQPAFSLRDSRHFPELQ